LIVAGGQIDPQSSSDPVRNLTGIYIKHVKPDSPAGASGLLKNGDRILEVYGCTCVCVIYVNQLVSQSVCLSFSNDVDIT